MPSDPIVQVMHYFVIFNPVYPLGFTFLFPYCDNWILLVPQDHQLLMCQGPHATLSHLSQAMSVVDVTSSVCPCHDVTEDPQQIIQELIEQTEVQQMCN